MASFEYIFPSIRGVQAGREYYISMCPLRLIPRIFLFDEEELKLAAEFWTEVSQHIGDWQLARQRKISASDLRRDYVHAHALALAALARVGNTLLTQHGSEWKSWLKKLASVDWSRGNSAKWEGRAMSAGRLSKRNVNVTLAGNLLKKHLGLELTSEEQELETQFRKSRNGRKNTK